MRTCRNNLCRCAQEYVVTDGDIIYFKFNVTSTGKK